MSLLATALPRDDQSSVAIDGERATCQMTGVGGRACRQSCRWSRGRCHGVPG